MTLRRLLFTAAMLAGAQAQASEGALEAPIVAHGEPAAQLQRQLDAKATFVAQYVAKDVEGAGKLSGVVSFAGAAPELPPLKHTKDQGVCNPTGPDETLL